jgi:ribosomal protein S18 acetylase RimI-like enzyme
MSTTKIRRGAIADLHDLAKLFDAYRVFYGKQSDISSASEFLRDRLINNESVIFVAETNGKPVGFTQLYPLFSSVRMKKLWLLNDLYVDESFRGRGISVQLLDAAKELCRETGACGMYLETAKSNEIGNSLYPRAGFTLNDEHNFYDWDVR